MRETKRDGNNPSQSTNVPSASGTLRSTFLRRRQNAPSNINNPNTNPIAEMTIEPMLVGSSQLISDSQTPNTTALLQSTNSTPEIPVVSGKVKRGIVLARKDIEVESGVEVLEDMIPSAMHGLTVNGSEVTTIDPSIGESMATSASKDSLHLPLQGVKQDTSKIITDEESKMTMYSAKSTTSIQYLARRFAMPLMLLLGLLFITLFPLHDFLRGVLSTIYCIILVESLSNYLNAAFEALVLKVHPERVPFQIPNYNEMPICEIPAAEEHRTIKAYAGWMNEVSSYDPNTFSFSMTRAVYVRLDGSILKMSGTNSRIPKRRMWNELPIDRKKVLFTDHRSYDLRNCRIELLPVGLAKKRYFNRKYPIQLIIKNECGNNDNDELPINNQSSVLDPALKLEAKEGKTMLNTGAGTAATTPTTAAVGDDTEKTVDFGGTVMKADLLKLRNAINPDLQLNDFTVPCGDEVRLLLFSRCDREKEDWYRRFVAASKGRVHEQDLHVPMARFVEFSDLQEAAARQAVRLVSGVSKSRPSKDSDERPNVDAQTDGFHTPEPLDDQAEDSILEASPVNDDFEGMIMSADVARNPADYVRFMATFQKACTSSHIPVRRIASDRRDSTSHRHRKARRAKRQEDELWKGINQSLFLGPSGSIVWANILLGRCTFSWLHDDVFNEKIKDFLQKKLNSIKLPSFMEEVIITDIYLGKAPMLVHRVSQPMLDERGVWLDADITYEGLGHITVTTKLNLLRIRNKPKAPPVDTEPPAPTPPVSSQAPTEASSSNEVMFDALSSAIYDSDAESTGGSSSEEETPPPGQNGAEATASGEFFQNSPGNARRIFKIVDRIATSNLFQYASELPYVQKAMENMNANITLRVDLKGLVARGTLNIPPPPSDRIWVCFRGPPRLWISTKPQLGDKSVDWTIVTNVIESKLCEAVNKFLVYPNMVDFTIPFLAKPSYDDEPPVTSPQASQPSQPPPPSSSSSAAAAAAGGGAAAGGASAAPTSSNKIPNDK